MNKELPLILWVIVLMIPFLIRAQEPAQVSKKDSAIKVNFITNGKYTHEVFTLNDELLTYGTLTSILKTRPGSAEELGKYNGRKGAAYTMLSIFLVSATAGLIQADHQKKTPGTVFSKSPVFFSISIGALFSAIILSGGNTHLNKAIEAYNRR